MVSRNAHLGHDLQYALADRLDVVFLHIIGRKRQALAQPDFLQRFKGDIGVDGFGAIACKNAEMMHFACLAGFDHKAGLHPQPLTDEVVVDGGGCQQCGHGDPLRSLRTVREDKDIFVLQYRFGCSPAHFLDRHFKARCSACGIPSDVDSFRAEGGIQGLFDRTDLGKIGIGQDGLGNLQPFVRPCIMAEQIGARADH